MDEPTSSHGATPSGSNVQLSDSTPPASTDHISQASGLQPPTSSLPATAPTPLVTPPVAPNPGPPQPEDVFVDKPSQAAQLFRLEVGQNEDGSPIYHSVLRMPTEISEKDIADIVKAPVVKEDPNSLTRPESTYNIIMLDTSGSMEDSLMYVVDAFNFKIAKFLDGETDVYSFSDVIKFIRSEAKLDLRDNIGKGTNLSGAIREIGYLVRSCPHKHVRVFFITDGHHTGPDPEPNVEIERMGHPGGKRVEVFLLGIKRSFPVKYSVQIRSRLHTGAANISTLYWAESINDIYPQIEKIKAEMISAVRMTLSVPFHTMPYLNTTRSNAYPGEYLYFSMDPEVLRSKLIIRVESEPKQRIEKEWRRRLEPSEYDDYDRYGRRDRYHRHDERLMMMMSRRGRMDEFDDMYEDDYEYGGRGRYEDEYYGMMKKGKKPAPKPVAPRIRISEDTPFIGCSVLMDNLFKQWCSVLNQMHNNKQKVPMEVFDLMEKSFKIQVRRECGIILEGKLNERMNRKSMRTLQTDFGVMMSTSRNIIAVESKYKNELELAEAILKTTVQSKHDTKLLKIKGHGDPDWKKDVEEFRKLLTQLYQRVRRLPHPSPEESCRILMTSFIGDLQDPLIFELLEQRGKLDFLQEMTFTGIPVFTPVKDFSQINPWTQHIKNICVSPFEILSQRAMESAIALQGTNDVSPNKEITLRQGDPTTVFNAIVPVIPRQYIDLLRPLLRTNVFSVGCTFCILKNANIVDHTCHIAALGCVWMKTIKDFPLETRPAYIKNRIANVEATARIYLDRQGIQTYIECLLKNPEQALCTESAEKYNDTTIKCESLVKPAFFLHLSRHNYALLEECQAKIPIIIQRVVMEFLGRCLSSYDSNTPYVDLFLPSISSDSRDEWIKGKMQEVFRKLDLTGTELLRQHFELNALKKFVKREMRVMFQKLKDNELGWRELMRHEREKVEREAARRTRRHSSDGSDMETNDADDEPIVDEPGSGEAPRIPKFVVPKPNMEKISHFRKSGSVGQVSFEGLRAWAIEMMHDLGFPSEAALDVSGAQAADEGQGFDGGQGGPDKGSGSSGSSGAEQTQLEVNEAPRQVQQTSAYLIQRDIDYAFGDDMLIVYLVHALNNRDSRARSRNTPPTVTEAIETLEKKLNSEWNRLVDSLLGPKLEERVRVEWLKAYKEAHSKLARPLTRLQIIEQAQARGIEVSKDTFNDVYRYRAESGLCRNCCQVEACPHYLVPNRRFNLHLEVEREQPDYPHTLHLSVSRLRPDVEAAVRQVTSCAATGTNERKKKKPQRDADSDKVTAYVEELQKKYDELK